MTNLEQTIAYEIEWRTDEISIIKTLPFLFSFSPKQKETLKKYTIPTLYALWEGFVSECFKIYVEELNKLKLSKANIHINILTHSIDMKYRLKNARTEFEKQKLLVKSLCEHLENEILLPVEIPTESNVNYKVINSILCRFNLKPLNQKEYEKRLDRLLFFRNKLAHGEHTIPVDQETIDEMSLTVILSMHGVAESIIDGYNERSYLGSPVSLTP